MISTGRIEVRVEAPREKVWQAMAVDFGEAHRFIPIVPESHWIGSQTKGEVGAARACTVEMGRGRTTQVREQITKMDTPKHLQWKGLDPQFPVREVVSQAWLEAEGSATRLAVQVDMSFRFPFSLFGAMMIRPIVDSTIKGLIGVKHYVETGEEVSAKNYDRIEPRHRTSVRVAGTRAWSPRSRNQEIGGSI
jgi:carbon monoxide dehydrogenase subunit G